MAINTDSGQLVYGNPNPDDLNSEQLKLYGIIRKALIETEDMLTFSKLSSSSRKVISNNSGKTLKGYRYFPILDDRNIGTHGLDSAGNAIANQNLYGSSMDIDTILNAQPILTEYGGRVNRVGISRETYEASPQEIGIFTEWTRNSLKFDTDVELFSHITRELMIAMEQIMEDRIAIDLISGAGVVLYGGVATKLDEVTGEATAAEVSVVDYDILQRVTTVLDDNKCRVDTTLYGGSTRQENKPISNARFAFMGSALRSEILKVTNYHNKEAFVNSYQYASAISAYGRMDRVFKGEVGAIDGLRFIIVDRMPYHAGKGATVNNNGGYRETGGKYDCYPILIVGSDSFSHLKFSSDYNESGQFEINYKSPKDAGGVHDPFHRNGYYSLSTSQGTLISHPEWIAVMWFVAEQ